MSGLSFFSYEGHYEDYSNICYKVRIESVPSEGVQEDRLGGIVRHGMA